MPIAPLRSLSEHGIITDVDPYTLPSNAFTGGVNIRFSDGGVSRAPVFRDVLEVLGTDYETEPRFVFDYLTSSGSDVLLIGYYNGRVTGFVNGAEENWSISGYSNSNSLEPFTAITLGGVVYINRSDRVPWKKTQGDAAFAALPNWNSAWRAKLLRTCGGALVALNVTKSGISYPTMVKTSEFPTYDSVPSTWDETDPENNSIENVLNEMDGPIVDGHSLGQNLFIYGHNEVWLMQPDRSEFVFNFTRQFRDTGVINANCVVEVDNKHYVFGPTDIWMHDGTSKTSICDQRVRRHIFRTLNTSEAHQCFVYHNKALKEIYFCYVSGDEYASFINGTGCNRAAVFSYTEGPAGVWSFYDLPFIVGGASAGVSSLSEGTATYASTSLVYSETSGTYLENEGATVQKRATLMLGNTAEAYDLTQTLYAFDLEGPGALVSTSANENATLGCQLVRAGYDLDEVGAEYRGYKEVNCIFPQARLAPDTDPIEFCFGSADYFSQATSFSDWQTYDGNSLYKLDYLSAGRYLDMKMKHEGSGYFNLTGIDFDLEVISER